MKQQLVISAMSRDSVQVGGNNGTSAAQRSQKEPNQGLDTKVGVGCFFYCTKGTSLVTTSQLCGQLCCRMCAPVQKKMHTFRTQNDVNILDIIFKHMRIILAATIPPQIRK